MNNILNIAIKVKLKSLYLKIFADFFYLHNNKKWLNLSFDDKKYAVPKYYLLEISYDHICMHIECVS